MKRRRRPRRQRKSTAAALAREADKLWGILVRRAGVCRGCGSRDRIQAAHGISRRYRHTRWRLENGFPLCARCHVYWTHRPIEWDVWLERIWGTERYRELRQLALRTERPDVAEALEVLRAAAGSGQ